ncbi:MAG: hypothetical protein IPP71_04465 [Bacteroidetes bacterium]|nr:hypothetical protein [Bacteroidota bacterium]
MFSKHNSISISKSEIAQLILKAKPSNKTVPIKNYFNTKSFKNTITFSISMPNYSLVSTSAVRGVLVWVDDVYLKKYDSAQNLISDGGVEHTTKVLSPLTLRWLIFGI